MRTKTGKIATLALLSAIVVLLQTLAGNIYIGPTHISLVLVPIVIGSIVLGAKYGAFLGLVFGIVVLISGITGADPFTNTLFVNHPVYTSIICLVKGALAGYCSGLIYKVVSKSGKTGAACVAAAAAAPVVNTGLFILGGLLLVSDTLSQNYVSDGTTVVYFLIIGCAGLNFIAEFVLNIVLAPAINTIISASKKKR